MTVNDLREKGFIVSEIDDEEIYSMTISFDEKTVFTKGKMCCPHENRRNVKELVMAHAVESLIEQKLLII